MIGLGRIRNASRDYPPWRSIMFCDIRDFTGLTEVLTPAHKQSLLNEYFTLMTGPIHKHGGEVMQGNFGSREKLDRTVIGDAVNTASRMGSKTKLYGVDIVSGTFTPHSGAGRRRLL